MALVFNGISHAVMMASPSDLELFGLGFALSEGLIQSHSECYDVEALQHGCGREVRIEISAERFAQLKYRRRSLAGRTGCGLCGVESLAAFTTRWPAVNRPSWLDKLLPQAVSRAVGSLSSHQPANEEVGSLHAAAWCSPEGAILCAKEDVGRHNALDKVIGALAAQGSDFDGGFVLMTSRLSYELVAKCAQVGITAIAGISGPSTLAIEIAQRTGITLFGYCRNERATQFTV